jgi:hypothetical protein
VTETNSIVAGNSAPNCTQYAGSGDINDGGNNITHNDASCPGANGDPKLGALADNGGPTKTLLPGSGSAAIGHVPLGACTVPKDQRGFPRPGQGKSACDSGAVETGPTPARTATSTSLASSSNPSTAGKQVTFTATVSPVPNGGTVVFKNGGTAIPGCGSAAVSASGQATCHVTYSSAGSHSIIATYSGDSTFSPSSSPALGQVVKAGSGGHTTIGTLTTKGTTAVVPLTCHGSAGAGCVLKLTLFATETLKGGKVISAAKGKKPKTARKKVVVGSAKLTLVGGKSRKASVSLNQLGKRLLAKLHKLKTSLVVSQTRGGKTSKVYSHNVSFKAKKKKKKH